MYFKNKTLLITGGTGTFGNAVLEKLISSDLKEIRIFSRDEKKQDDMRKKYSNPKIKFYLGDVRNKTSLDYAIKGIDYIFHAAALKQVPSCEFFPVEALYTNSLGTDNVLNVAIENKVKKVIVLSTDKAVYPINAMGISKAMMEKIAIAKSRSNDNCKICITRYGNVMASRGSVIPLWINRIQNNQPITITDPSMTRFMMTIEEAVDLVIFAFEGGNSGDMFVQKTPSCTLETLAIALKELLNSDVPIDIIGTRHGEKVHETLLTCEEFKYAHEYSKFFRIPLDKRDLNYFLEENKKIEDLTTLQDYTSNNTKILTVEELKEVLSGLKLIKRAMRGEHIEI